MSKLAFGRPLGKSDLSHKFRSDPVGANAWGIANRKRTGPGFKLCELIPQSLQSFVVEARADLACIHQLPSLVIAHQERPKPHTVAFWLREPADNEFLLSGALELKPLAGPRRDIQAVGLFCHDAFPPFSARLLVIAFAFGLTMLGETYRVGKINRFSQQLFPVVQRQSAGVVTIQVQQIENIDPNRDFTTEFFGWMPDLHALLKPREAGHVAVEGDDFAVHSEAFCFLI